MTQASQLIAEVKTVGADTTEAQMLAVSAASDASAVSLGTVVTASTALSRNMAELSAMTAEGAASFGTLAAAEDTTDASTAALNAQFAAMRARFAEVSAQANIEGASMLRSAEASRVSADMHAKFGAALQRVGNVAKDVIVTLGKIALVSGLIAAVIGLIATKVAGDFEQALTTLVTGAGEAANKLDLVRAGILQLAIDTATSTGDLVKGMYMIESAGFHGAAGLAVLKAAAMGAKVGAADLGAVANGVTTILTDYGLGADKAAFATNILIETVKLGKSHMQDMAQAFATVLPAAAKAGISIQSVAAAMATMTAQGTPAADAATYLKQTIIALEAPAKKGATTLREIGLTTKQVAAELRVSLPDAIAMIVEHLKKKFPEGSAAYIEALKNIAGGSRQMQALLELTGTSLSTLESNFKQVSASAKLAGTSIMGWSTVQKDFNFQVDKAKSALQVLTIQLGSALLPLVNQFLQWLIPLVQKFVDWESKTHGIETALAQTGGVINTVIGFVKSLFPVLQQVGGFLSSTFAPVWDQLRLSLIELEPYLPAIANFIGGVLVGAFALFVGVLAGTVKAVAGLLEGIIQFVAGAIEFITGLMQFFGAFSSFIFHLLTGQWSKAWADAGNMLKAFGTIVQGSLNMVTGIFKAFFSGIIGFAQGFVRGVLGFLSLIPGSIGQMARDAIKQLDIMTGAVNKAGVEWKRAALLHSLAMQQGVVDNLKKMAADVEVQLLHAQTASQKHMLQMKLDAINAAIATNQGVLKQYQAMADGVDGITGKMVATVSSHFSLMQQQATQKARQMSTDLVGHSIIPNMVTSIVGVFAKLPGAALSAVSGLAGKLSGFFTGLASQALTWGLHIIQNVASGISAGYSAAVGAAQRIASAVAGILGHSKPVMGPLMNDDVWGAHLVDNFVKGIVAGTPRVQSALAGMFGGMPALGVSGSFSGASPAYFGGSSSPVIHVHVHNDSSPVYLDGRQIAEGVMPHAVRIMRQQNGNRRPT